MAFILQQIKNKFFFPKFFFLKEFAPICSMHEFSCPLVARSMRSIQEVVFHPYIAQSSRRTLLLVAFCSRYYILKYSLLVRVIEKEIARSLATLSLAQVGQNLPPMGISDSSSFFFLFYYIIITIIYFLQWNNRDNCFHLIWRRNCST